MCIRDSASTSTGFSLATSTLKSQFKVGEIPCTASHIKHQIPAIGEIQMPNGSTHFFRFTAVDAAGNESEPSDEQSANGNLVATANISDAAISSAKIANLAVTDAKIATLSAGKITAGTISGQTIIVGTNTSDSAIIKSSNYSTGSAGWKIDSDGTAEFESGNFRGNITGATGTFSGDLNAAGGTFSGNLSAAGGTFSGNLSAAGGTFTGTLSGVDGSFSGNISANQVTADTLNLSRIPSGIQAKIDALGIDAGKIANGAVEAAKIAAGAVISDKLADGSVTNAKIDTINASKITAGTMSANRIESNAGFTGSITASLSLNAPSVSGTTATFSTVDAYTHRIRGTSSTITGGSFIALNPLGSIAFKATTSENQTYEHLKPNSDNTTDLGDSNQRYRRVYRLFESSASDQRLKENIAELTYGLDFINNLEPKEFTWKQLSLGFSCNLCNEFYTTDDECTTENCEGTLEEIFTDAGDNTVFGFLAQDMENYIDDSKVYEILNYDEEKILTIIPHPI